MTGAGTWQSLRRGRTSLRRARTSPRRGSGSRPVRRTANPRSPRTARRRPMPATAHGHPWTGPAGQVSPTNWQHAPPPQPSPQPQPQAPRAKTPWLLLALLSLLLGVGGGALGATLVDRDVSVARPTPTVPTSPTPDVPTVTATISGGGGSPVVQVADRVLPSVVSIDVQGGQASVSPARALSTTTLVTSSPTTTSSTRPSMAVRSRYRCLMAERSPRRSSDAARRTTWPCSPLTSPCG